MEQGIYQEFNITLIYYWPMVQAIYIHVELELRMFVFGANQTQIKMAGRETETTQKGEQVKR